MTHDDLTVSLGEGGFNAGGDFHAWIEVTQVPEPSSLVLLAFGLSGLALRRRLR